MYKYIQSIFILLFTLALSACDGINDGEGSKFITPAQTGSAVATFNPSASQIPTTNILLLGDDGKLALPLSGDAGVDTLLGVLNELDGYSTTSPITYSFAAGVDPATLVAGSTVHLLEVTSAGPAATGLVSIVNPAAYTVIVTDSTATTIAIVPLAPLSSGSTYVVALTDGIIGADGLPVAASPTYLNVKGTDSLVGTDLEPLDGLRQLINSYEGVAAAAGIDGSSIVLSWMFPTLDVTTVLSSMTAAVKAAPPTGVLVAGPTGLDTAALGLQGAADIYAGTIDLPYYLGIPTPENPAAPLTASWTGQSGTSVSKFDPLPTLTGTQTVPVLMTLPKTPPPATGYPVTIFQHGITRNRTDMLALADSQAAAGRAVIAIDIPLHGLDATNPLFAGPLERTFALDFQGGGTDPCAPEPDGVPDSSGAHFLNLASLLTARDNNRQAIMDLVYLANSLGNLNTIGIPLDTSNVGFIGQSLGAIVGTGFLAMEDSVGAASLSVPGGGIAGLLAGSVSFSPVINGGLACNGIAAGSSDYFQFLTVAQSAIDAADPINHAAAAAAAHNIHMTEVIGGNASLPDQVVPNSVDGFPLSGTEPLIRAMGLVATGMTTQAGNLDVAVRFIAGDHGSLLSPTGGLDVTIEMQGQSASFLASGGNALVISDPSLVQQP